ncbi:carbonic anhydrase [Streptomyces albiaxialis]|uniref:carbonic anhydrase n=1 Tax=Streptomyces albiaxialis TaxID=329523 RepID=A0ABN2VUQ3_9ACTN
MPVSRSLSHKAQHGQSYGRRKADKVLPKVLFISCTEARLAPQRFVSDPGQLFEIRNIGNIVPPHNPRIISGDIATIEYGLALSNLKDVVISGHSGCGAVAALLGQETVSASVRRWLVVGNSRTVSREAVGLQAGASVDSAARDRAARAHLLAQLAHLAGYPGLEAGRSNGGLRLRALFDTEAGTTEVYSPREDRFVPLGRHSTAAAR